MNKNDKIYVAGHTGMVGSAIIKSLEKDGYSNLVFRTSKELNLKDSLKVEKFFELEKPDIVIFAAAKVGGIQANINNPAIFLFDNLLIQNNVIKSALDFNVKKFLFLGSSCIYPKECLQPMKEEYLMTGKLEPTNEGYAIAKITGIKLLEAFNKQYGFDSISLMPCNLYGPNDSFDAENSHVLSALVKKFVDAEIQNLDSVILWGSGNARREFMHVNDMANAVKYFLENYNDTEFINIGPGVDISIKELAVLIASKVGFSGLIKWDISKPDGMLRKCMDVTKMKKNGFSPKISLNDGIIEMIKIYKNLN